MKDQLHGTIKYVNVSQGYGFITPAIAGTPDVCFFFDQLRGNAARMPQKGEKVIYEEGVGKRGPIATTVYNLADPLACEDHQADIETAERLQSARRKAAMDQLEAKARLIARNAAWHAARKDR